MELIDRVKTAIEYTKKRDFKQAEKIYLEILKENPDNNTILSFLGILYYETKKLKKSDKYLTKSYKIQASKSLLPYLGKVKYYLEDYDEAIKYLELAVAENPTIELYHLIINSCSRKEDYKRQKEFAEAAYKIFPFDSYILYKLTDASINTGDFKAGEHYCSLLVKQYPDMPSAWSCLGLLNELLYGAEDNARRCYKNMAKLGDKIGGYSNLVISYGKTYSPKTKYYINKIKPFAKDNNLNFLIASYYLTNKQFKKGYSYYIQKDIRNKFDKLWFNRFKSPWTGGTFKDETLFVYGDQGLGDQIQHARYLPYLAKKFGGEKGKIKVMFASALVDIMKRSFKQYPNIQILDRNKKFPKYDKSVMLADALYYLNMNFNHIPSTDKYLTADKNKIIEYENKFFNTNNLKVGLCWETGGKGIRDQIHRTINISFFDEILKLDNINFYSFQKKPRLDDYKEYKQLINISENFKNFDDTAAALKNLDLLITVDTSVAHMAGALGVKTFLLLPYCPDWRWFKNTKKTEWYDSITIFKQEHMFDWDNIFKHVKSELLKIQK